MYLGIILIGLGVVLAVLNPWVLLLFCGGFLLRYLYLFPKEEKILSDAFGQRYKEYMSRVPRLLPNPAALAARNISSYLPVRLSWFRREIPSISIVLAIVFLIEAWEELKSRDIRAAVTGSLPQLLVVVVYFFLVLYLAQTYERQEHNGKNTK